MVSFQPGELLIQLFHPGLKFLYGSDGVRQQIGDNGEQEHPIDERRDLRGFLVQVEMIRRRDRFRFLEGPEHDLRLGVGVAVPGFGEGEAGLVRCHRTEYPFARPFGLPWSIQKPGT